MNSTQVKCFLEIVRCGLNYSKAAQSLFITQPVLSRHINKLEAELSVSLLNTSNKKAVELTTAGKVLYDFFDNVSRNFEDALAKVAEISERPIGKIKIAYFHAWDVLDVMAKADQFSKKYPDTDITFVSLNFEEIARGLRSRDFDVAFTTLFSVKNVPELYIREVEDSPMMLLFSSGGRMISNDAPLTFAGFKDDTLYVLASDEESVSLEMYTRVFLCLGFTPKITILPNFDTILMRIQGGRGYMVISQRIRIKDSPEFFYLPLGINDKTVVAWRKDDNNITVRKFVDEFLR